MADVLATALRTVLAGRHDAYGVESTADMILVTGPESSGSGATAALVRAMGFEVIHRAVPHIDDWEPFALIERQIHWAVVTHREPWALFNAQVKNGQSESIDIARYRVASAYEYIFETIPPFIPLIPVTYEGLFDCRGVEGLAKLLGAEANYSCIPLENRNWQY